MLPFLANKQMKNPSRTAAHLGQGTGHFTVPVTGPFALQTPLVTRRLLRVHDGATVDVDGLAGDVRRIKVAGQKDVRWCHFLRLARALHRDIGTKLVDLALGKA